MGFWKDCKLRFQLWPLSLPINSHWITWSPSYVLFCNLSFLENHIIIINDNYLSWNLSQFLVWLPCFTHKFLVTPVVFLFIYFACHMSSSEISLGIKSCPVYNRLWTQYSILLNILNKAIFYYFKWKFQRSS